MLVCYGFNKKMGLIVPFRLMVMNDFCLNHTRWWIFVRLADDGQTWAYKIENSDLYYLQCPSSPRTLAEVLSPSSLQGCVKGSSWHYQRSMSPLASSSHMGHHPWGASATWAHDSPWYYHMWVIYRLLFWHHCSEPASPMTIPLVNHCHWSFLLE